MPPIVLQPVERFDPVGPEMVGDRYYNTSDINAGGHVDDDDTNDVDNGNDDITRHRRHSTAFSWTRQTQ